MPTLNETTPLNRYRCGVTAAGAAYCWGGNDSYFGLLGNGTNTNSNVPVLVDLTFSP